MPDLTARPLLRCPDCGREYPGLRRAPAGGTCSPISLHCLGCGREHVVCVWIADIYRPEKEVPRG